eukprot:c13180_g9_i1.p1 GENE.c13180_g9_i1~~c13180_g9_i1.p1  ORF type:complete len:267 (+),score=20.89 c13180_g9_i1:350-1150(+)
MEGLGRLMVKGGESFPARDWLCASWLIPIKKKPSGVRPIACGEAFTRPVTITSEDILLPEQFGVGSPGGVEPVVWSAGDTIAQENCEGFLKIDFSNAFNTVSILQISKTVRERVPPLFLLVKLLNNTPSPLVVRLGASQVEGGARHRFPGPTKQGSVGLFRSFRTTLSWGVLMPLGDMENRRDSCGEDPALDAARLEEDLPAGLSSRAPGLPEAERWGACGRLRTPCALTPCACTGHSLHSLSPLKQKNTPFALVCVCLVVCSQCP